MSSYRRRKLSSVSWSDVKGGVRLIQLYNVTDNFLIFCVQNLLTSAGTAGIKILSSKDAKKVYTQCTAAVLRAKDCVMKTVTNIQENAEDIYSEAMQINEERASEDSEFDDESETEVENDTMKTEE